MNEELIAAAIQVVEVAEVTAKMGMHPDFHGCTLEYVTTILTRDDERFVGMDPTETRWQLYDAFFQHPGMHVLNKDGSSRRGMLWATVPTDEFKAIFKPKGWLL